MTPRDKELRSGVAASAVDKKPCRPKLEWFVAYQIIAFLIALAVVSVDFVPDGVVEFASTDGLVLKNLVFLFLITAVSLCWGLTLDVVARCVLLIAALPFSVYASIGSSGLALDFPAQILILAFLPSLLRACKKWNRPTFRWLYVLFVLLSISALLGATSLTSLRGIVRYAVYVFGAFCCGLVLARQQKALRDCFWLLGTGSALVSLLVITRVAEGMDVGWLGANFAAPFLFDRGSGAAYITFGVIVLMMTVGGLREASRWQKTLVYTLLVLDILAVVLSGTRAAWIGLAAALAVVGFHRKRYMVLSVALLLAVGGIVYGARNSVFMQQNLDRLLPFMSGESALETVTSAGDRLARWTAALEMVQVYPVLGIGYDGFGTAIVDWPSAPDLPPWGVHNEHLKVAVEGGLPAFAIYIGLLVAAIWIGLRWVAAPDSALTPATTATRATITAALVCVVSYTVQGFFNNFQQVSKVTIPYWLMIGFLFGIRECHEALAADARVPSGATQPGSAIALTTSSLASSTDRGN